MAGEQKNSAAKLEGMSRAIRQIVHQAEEKELDGAIRGAGENPQAVAEEGRLAVERALAEYGALRDVAPCKNRRQGYLPGPDR